jgi:hypothetical protein
MTEFYFYIVVDGEEWYWNGRRFHGDFDNCLEYSAKKSKQFVLNNYKDTPFYREMIEHAEPDEIMIKIY